MGKRIGRRRFDEPRFGVSQGMVDAERRELQREFDSYLLQSLNELKEQSEERLREYRRQDQSLQGAISRLPERERLAVMCILGRDLLLVQAVFVTFLEGRPAGETTSALEPIAEASLPFSEWLFAK